FSALDNIHAEPRSVLKKANRDGSEMVREPRTTNGSSRPSQWSDDPKLLKLRKELPIWSYRSEIQGALRRSNILLIVGETGSGKSTQTPQFLYREPWCRKQTKTVQLEDGTQRQVEVGGMVAVTQPR